MKRAEEEDLKFRAVLPPKGSGKPEPVGKDAPESLDVAEILRGRRRINLLHGGEVYRLQVTRQGKLLLTK